MEDLEIWFHPINDDEDDYNEVEYDDPLDIALYV